MSLNGWLKYWWASFVILETKIETIVPLIKQLCQKTSGAGDTTFPTIAREFGKLVEALENDLEISDCIWILQFFKTLATRGQTVRLNKDNLEVTQVSTKWQKKCNFFVVMLVILMTNSWLTKNRRWAYFRKSINNKWQSNFFTCEYFYLNISVAKQYFKSAINLSKIITFFSR